MPRHALGASLFGHGGTPLCGSTPGSEKCRVARTEILMGDPTIEELAWDVGYTDPCVMEGTIHHPMWLFLGSVSPSSPVIEMGVWKAVGDPGTPVSNEIYTCCIRCNNGSGAVCKGYGPLHNDGMAWLQFSFDPANGKWRFFAEQSLLDEVSINQKGIAVGAGGEADYWQNDLGVLWHRHIFWHDGTQWHGFNPFNTAFEEAGYGGRWNTRFRVPPANVALGWGWPNPSVSVFSDHHLSHETDACGHTP